MQRTQRHCRITSFLVCHYRLGNVSFNIQKHVTLTTVERQRDFKNKNKRINKMMNSVISVLNSRWVDGNTAQRAHSSKSLATMSLGNQKKKNCIICNSTRVKRQQVPMFEDAKIIILSCSLFLVAYRALLISNCNKDFFWWIL